MSRVDDTINPYLPGQTSDTFDADRWVASQDWEALSCPEGRRLLTRYDPMLFALVYLPHHLTGEIGHLSFADPHFDWYQLMRQWAMPLGGPREWRHSIAAPRSSAKTTIWFTAAPLWAACHGHIRFVAAFADSGTQAEMHLQTYRGECSTNALLRSDYPDVCAARRRPTGQTTADNVGMYQARSGFVFAARGADTASLGMKVDEQRPDVIILDDIEKHESQYSDGQVGKRLATILHAILPLNERARVVIVGTTTRTGSIVHQLVQVADGAAQPTGDLAWISDERIAPHHHVPIVRSVTGARRSIWPAKWPLEYLEAIEETRSYALNMLCDPSSESGVYWDSSDHIYRMPAGIERVYAWLDPPVTSTDGADPAGLVVAGYLPRGIGSLAETLATGLNARGRDPDTARVQVARQRALDAAVPGREWRRRRSGVVILHAEEIRGKTGRPLMRHVAGSLAAVEARTGKRIRKIICESNQGGELWRDVSDDLVIPLRLMTVSDPKRVRIEASLDYYQSLRVLHAERMPDLERQQLSYPAIAHDDVIDAAASAVLGFLGPRRGGRSRTTHQR